jgi:hypothetical protein
MVLLRLNSACHVRFLAAVVLLALPWASSAPAGQVMPFQIPGITVPTGNPNVVVTLTITPTPPAYPACLVGNFTFSATATGMGQSLSAGDVLSIALGNFDPTALASTSGAPIFADFKNFSSPTDNTISVNTVFLPTSTVPLPASCQQGFNGTNINTTPIKGTVVTPAPCYMPAGAYYVDAAYLPLSTIQQGYTPSLSVTSLPPGASAAQPKDFCGAITTALTLPSVDQILHPSG